MLGIFKKNFEEIYHFKEVTIMKLVTLAFAIREAKKNYEVCSNELQRLCKGQKVPQGKRISKCTKRKNLCKRELESLLKELDTHPAYNKLSKSDKKLFNLFFCRVASSTYIKNQIEPDQIIDKKNLTRILRNICIDAELD